MRLHITYIAVIILLLTQGCSHHLDKVNSNGNKNANSGLIALTLRDQNSRLQIFTITPDGLNRKQLTFEGDNGRPDWSPEGKRITFGSIRNGKV